MLHQRKISKYQKAYIFWGKIAKYKIDAKEEKEL